MLTLTLLTSGSACGWAWAAPARRQMSSGDRKRDMETTSGESSLVYCAIGWKRCQGINLTFAACGLAFAQRHRSLSPPDIDGLTPRRSPTQSQLATLRIIARGVRESD